MAAANETAADEIVLAEPNGFFRRRAEVVVVRAAARASARRLALVA